MNEHKTIKKYFNRRLQKLSAFFLFYYGIGDVLCLAVIGFVFYRYPDNIMFFLPILVIAIITLFIVIGIYRNQRILIKSKFGKNLKKYLGDKDAAIEALDQIDYEIDSPLYSDVTSKDEFNNFMITKNWVIGNSGLYLARPTGVKLADIKEIKPFRQVVHYRAHRWYAYGINAIDSKGNRHVYYLRDENYRDKALAQLNRLLQVDANTTLDAPFYDYFARLTQQDIQELKNLIREDRKMMAIKVCKDKTGAGLKETKEFVERLQ